jgi:hypothetical protein
MGQMLRTALETESKAGPSQVSLVTSQDARERRFRVYKDAPGFRPGNRTSYIR